MKNAHGSPRCFPFGGTPGGGSAHALAGLLGMALVTFPVMPARGGPTDSEQEDYEWVEYEDEDSVWSFGFELNFLSQYAFRDVLYTEGPVMQPYAYVSYGIFTLDCYANMNLDARDPNQGRFNEIDFDLYLTAEVGDLTIEPGFTYYHYPLDDENPDTGEVFLSLTYPIGPFSVLFVSTVDVIEYPGFYYGAVGLFHEAEITESIHLESGLYVDYANDPDEDDDEYMTLIPSLSATFYLGEHLYVTPHVSFTHFLQSDFEPEDDDYFIYGVSIGVLF